VVVTGTPKFLAVAGHYRVNSPMAMRPSGEGGGREDSAPRRGREAQRLEACAGAPTYEIADNPLDSARQTSVREGQCSSAQQ